MSEERPRGHERRDPPAGHPATTMSTDAGLSWSAPADAAGVDVPSCQVSLLGLGPNNFWHDALLMAAPWGPADGARANMTISVNHAAGAATACIFGD